MEFVDGVNLRQAMQAGRFTPAQALAIVPKICEALQFAHNEGILHRDIKPENILLDAKGRVKIADFGIAKLVGNVALASQPAGSGGIPAASSWNTEQGCSVHPQAGKPALQSDALTDAGKTLGSPNYMAPEQLEHPGEVDHRADIYSLGVVFYEMLTGELPLGRFAPPSQKSAADPRVDEVVLRALEKERERRQHSAGEVKTQVETIASTSGGSGRQPRESEAMVDVESQTGPLQAGANKRRLTGFQILLRSVVVVFIAGLLVFALAAAVTSLLPKTYAATARVELSSQDGNFLQNEFARMESPEFLKQVEATADLKRRWKSSLSGNDEEQMEQITVRLRNAMELRPIRNTSIILVSFYSESPGEAADIANAITTVYCSQPGARIVDIATVPARPVRPNAMLNLAIGAVGGVFFGLVAGGLAALFLVRRQSYPSSGSRREEAQTEKSEIGNRKSEIEPRFSRMAIVGAMWAICLLLTGASFACLKLFGLTSLTRAILMVCGGLVSVIGFTAPLGTTILGWIAVSQIRRSTGKLYGMWLAVFDGLLFPLLVLDGAIVGAVIIVLRLLDQVLHDWTVAPIFGSVLLLAPVVFGIIVLADFLIIRRVWRAVKRPVGVPVPLVQKPDRFWRWFAVAVFAMIAIPFLISIVGLLAAIAIPNFVKARAQSQENARRAAAQMATNQLPSQNLSFGPVTECTLPTDKDGLTPLFDLDQNRSFPNDAAAGMAQLLKPGVVIRHDTPAHKFAILGMSGTKLYWTRASLGDQWEKLTDTNGLAAVRQNTMNPGVIQGVDCPDNLPQAFFFKTSAGRLGILQITSLTENPPGVKIRYKLVQTIGTTTTSVSMPPTAAPNPAFDSFVERVRKELSRASIRFDRLHISAVDADNFIVSFSGLEAHGVSNGKDAWLPIVGSVGSLVAQRGFFGGKWDFKGLNQLAVVRFTIADLDLEKLLETNLAEAMPAPPTAAPNPSFGPVIERILNETSTNRDCALDLDTGNLLTPPQNVLKQFTIEKWNEHYGNRDHADWKEMQDWARSSGADLICSPSEIGQLKKEGPTLLNSYKTAEGADYWTMSAINLVRLINKKVEFDSQPGGSVGKFRLGRFEPSTTGTLNMFDGKLPQTFAFETREGSQGVLQITGFTENPRGVKLRYKLVQPEKK